MTRTRPAPRAGKLSLVTAFDRASADERGALEPAEACGRPTSKLPGD